MKVGCGVSGCSQGSGWVWGVGVRLQELGVSEEAEVSSTEKS